MKCSVEDGNEKGTKRMEKGILNTVERSVELERKSKKGVSKSKKGVSEIKYVTSDCNTHSGLSN